MCLIALAINSHPKYKLILAANRDEFYERPTTQAHWWAKHPDVLAGKDLKSGGTWIGINKSLKWSAITNYRDPSQMQQKTTSRGHLVSNYLIESQKPEAYLSYVKTDAAKYNGFNLLAADAEKCWYYSNMMGKVLPVDSGVHALSNHFLDTPWPKARQVQVGLEKLISKDLVNPDSLFELMMNKNQAADETLPDTGIDLELERKLSPVFIQFEKYGTRSTTVLLIDQHNESFFSEVTWNETGQQVSKIEMKI
ncbi:MAG: NRDE family protein [Cyclobacteriaceae bacterium]